MSTSASAACRSCGSTGLQRILHHDGLDVVLCRGCSLVQLAPATQAPTTSSLAVSPPSPSSVPLIDTAGSLARSLITERGLGRDSLVIEAGSGDGQLLRHYRQAGVPVLGIEPSRPAATLARQRYGVPTREAAFTLAIADRLVAQGLHCDLFHAHDVLPRAADPNAFLQAVRRVLQNDGLAVIETPYVRDLLDRGAALDAGRLCWFSLTALCHCTMGHGLIIVDVERVPACGGSLRLFVSPAGANVWPRNAVVRMLAEEEEWGVRRVEAYAGLARRLVA